MKLLWKIVWFVLHILLARSLCRITDIVCIIRYLHSNNMSDNCWFGTPNTMIVISNQNSERSVRIWGNSKGTQHNAGRSRTNTNLRSSSLLHFFLPFQDKVRKSMCFRRISNSFVKKNTFGIRCPPNQTSQRISRKDLSMSHIGRSLPQNTEHTWNFGAMRILTNIRRIRKHRLCSVCSRRRHSERIRENRFWSVHLRRCHIRIRRYISHSFPHIFVEGPQHWEKRKRTLLCALYCLRLT